MRTFDIVVPTARLDEQFLSSILELDVPFGVRLHYYLVIDQPGYSRCKLPGASSERSDVTVLQNGRNFGAAESRNRGFNAGWGEFVLFLDDDVIPESGLIVSYVRAIDGDPNSCPGYVGVTRFPAPVNRFTSGVRKSDILTFFDIAATRTTVAWGVTANLCVRRAAVGPIRFAPVFPRNGGGEDIDFCLRVAQRAGGRFLCVRDAAVLHPWWNGGRRSYRRFFRWAYGDSLLPQIFPSLRYRSAPSFADLSFITMGVLFPLVWSGAASVALKFLAGALIIELFAEYARLLLRGMRVSPMVSAEASLVRIVNDFGRLLGNLSRFHLTGMVERFDYFTTGESIAHERLVAGIKLAGWVALALLLLWRDWR